MKWSLRIGRFFGIDVHVHFTFVLLLLFLGFGYWQSTHRIDAVLAGLSYLLALFGCVLLHEFGHALTARRYGIKTQDITLLPIGGVARLERMPEKPSQELWVALAGPAVNVVIAAALLLWLVVSRGMFPALDFTVASGPFVQRLLMINVLLAGFNLLPAFPMDGGRVLRAVLATRMGRRRATAIAANVGQGMAILLGTFGFFYNPFLVFIAIFIYLGAQAEAGVVEMQSALGSLHVRDAMITRFRTLSAGDTLEHAVEELLAGSQQDFPVLDGSEPIGILRRNDLVKALAMNRRDAPVAQFMCRECESVDDSESLTRTMEAMQTKKCSTLPVTRAGRIVGLLTMENVSEMIMINSALEKGERSVP